MKKSLLALGLVLGMSSAAMADDSNVTCIGTLDGVNARMVLLGTDDKGEIEIHIDGDDTYSGEYENRPKSGIVGQIKSESGTKLDFGISFLLNKKHEMYGAFVGVFRSSDKRLVNSTLNCVSLQTLSTK